MVGSGEAPRSGGSGEAQRAGSVGSEDASEAKSKLLLMSAMSGCAFSLSKHPSPSGNGKGLFERNEAYYQTKHCEGVQRMVTCLSL